MKLEIFSQNHTTTLANILNTDLRLRSDLESTKKISAQDFLEQTNSWISKTHSESFAIVENTTPIGLISLSHINKKGGSARIGYWIASKYWGLGITTEAFKEILDLAREKGLLQVQATIPQTSFASLKIWQNFGAKIETNLGSYRATIGLINTH